MLCAREPLPTEGGLDMLSVYNYFTSNYDWVGNIISSSEISIKTGAIDTHLVIFLR